MPLPRSLLNFYDTWQQYSAPLPTGSLFLEWACILAISGALTRRVWLRTKPIMPPLFPNLFALLTGDPGTGKDIAMGLTRKGWIAACATEDPGYQLNIGAISISAKGLVDAFASERSSQVMEHPGKPNTQFHSVLLCAGELGTLMPEYEAALAAMLNEAYNCGDKIDDQVRDGSGEPVEAANPHISVLLGTQPSFLASSFPEEAYGMGFFARLNLVFEPNLQRKPLYHITEDEELLTQLEAQDRITWNKLVSDLRIMLHLTGQFTVPNDVRILINNFHMGECDKTAPTHTRFKNYNVRRSLHAQKLAMCFSVARSSELVMQKEDWLRALDLLFRTEDRFPKIFADLATERGFHNSVEEVMHTATNEGTVIHERDMVKQLRKKHKPYEIKPIIQSMLDGGELREIKSTLSGRIFRVSDAAAKLKLAK